MAYGPFNVGGGGGGGGAATDVTYTSNNDMFTAGNVQDAIDSLVNKTLPRLVVMALEGSEVEITDGTTTITNTMDATETFTTYLPNTGVWTITAELDGDTVTQRGQIDATGKTYTVEMFEGDAYGVEWDKSSKSTLTRTDLAALFVDPVPSVNGSAGSSPFDDIMPWSGMTKVEDAQAGTLVAIPKFYYRWTDADGKLKLQISRTKGPGYHVSPAHADRGDGEGERDTVYIARYKCATDTYKSTTGVKPATYETRAEFRENIHALGDTIWQQDFAMFWTTRMLYLVEFADWNGQAAIGYNCGAGSTVGAENMGATDSMTYHTGTVQASKDTYGVGVQYRWIEDPWGNVLEWCDGIYFSGADVYCIKNPEDFSDTEGGTLVGTRPTRTGYISGWSIPTAAGYEYALYPSEVNGSEDESVCDRCYYSAAGVVLCVGGSYNQNQYYGPFYLNGSRDASNSDANIGSRLQKIP